MFSDSKSSIVREVKYHSAGVLEVLLKTGGPFFYKCSKQLFDLFHAAESRGSFYVKHVRVLPTIEP